MAKIFDGRFAAAFLRTGPAAIAMAVFMTASASAAGLLAPAASTDLRAAAGQGSSLGTLIKRSRIARLDVGELSRHIAPLQMDTADDRIARSRALDGVVTIELFPDAVATFTRDNVDTIGDSGYAWVGKVDQNPLYYASLIVENGEVTGHIQLAHRLFEIEPLSGGLHRVVEIDQSKFPPDERPGGAHTHGVSHGQLGTNEYAEDGRVAKTTVRVLAAYTKKSMMDAGGTTAKIVAQIKQAVTLANIGYTNTGIPMKIVLAGTMSAGNYVESGDIGVDLDNLDGVGPKAAQLKPVRTKRTALKADLVSLFRKSDPSFCGIANLTDHPSAATKNFAYHVMNWECVSNLSFHHEMGHNMGLRHDRFVDPTVGVGYNHGYVNKACKIRSVMGYNNACGNIFCTRVNVFSTGSFTVKVGAKKCAIGVKKGKPSASDNTQRLKETRTAISKYVAGDVKKKQDVHGAR